MLKNPQSIIRITSQKANTCKKLPDAIYIPFKDRHHNLNSLLSELSWYINPIIVLTSGRCDLNVSTTQNISLIDCDRVNSKIKIEKLKTFEANKYVEKIKKWDLPLKRNIALIDALENSFEKILLIDDDIQGISKYLLYRGVNSLNYNHISGALVTKYADTSVIGHIEQKYGESYFPFMSGNFLFIAPQKVQGFFPLIYNEDWIFMIPSILTKNIIAVGTISQKKYDPFDDMQRITLQEFGEVIAEGLFELINRKEYHKRYDFGFWKEYIDYRRSYIQDLVKIADLKFMPFLREALKLNKDIKPQKCISFISDWESDKLTFNKIKNEAKKNYLKNN